MTLGILSSHSLARASSAPAWVARGSQSTVQGDARVFYGVGSASNIKNPALLRVTADDRARAEIARVITSFSSSLMHDTMDSSGQQNVDQAINTVAKSSLQGVQIVDRYVSADGTVYALAALDLEKMMPAIEEAQRKGIVKTHPGEAELDEIFDRGAKRQETPKSPTTSPTTVASPSKKSAGGVPEWVSGGDARYPALMYLCAVGMGKDRGGADSAGYAALAKIFSANVASTSQDFMSAYSQTGAAPVETQSSEVLTKITTDTVLRGVQVLESYSDGKSTTYSLACLDRQKSGDELRSKMSDLDRKAEHSLSQAEQLDQAGKIRELARALGNLLERESLNSQLRIIDAQGVGYASPFVPADVASHLETAVAALRLGVQVTGPYDSDFHDALVEALGNRGYQIVDEGDSAPLDVVIAATTRVEDGGTGQIAGQTVVYARGLVSVSVKNRSTGKVLMNVNESRREGHRNMTEAERKAVRQLAPKIAEMVSAKLDSTMRGTTKSP